MRNASTFALVLAILSGGPATAGSIDLSKSVSHRDEGWAGNMYSFPVPVSNASFVGLAGNLSVTATGRNAFTEALMGVYDLPQGSCPGTTFVNGLTEYKDFLNVHPRRVLAQFMVKLAAAGTIQLPTNITLPLGVPISNCLILQLWGGFANGGTYTMTSTMKALYTTDKISSPGNILPFADELCFDTPQGCNKAANATGYHVSMARVVRINQRATLLALYGDISDASLRAHGGRVETWNNYYVYPQCELTGPVSGPADYYSAIPSNAIPLLDVHMQGPDTAPLQRPVNKNFNIQLNVGDCLVHLVATNLSAPMSTESQIYALLQHSK
jgi:hypothetical protein